MKRKELILLNVAFSEVKVVGLAKEPSLKYFKLKIALSEEIAKMAEFERTAKEQTKPDDVEDESQLSELQFRNWKNAFEPVMADYQEQELEGFPDTRILTDDELYDCMLSSELNKEMNTEKKAVLMKYLVK